VSKHKRLIKATRGAAVIRHTMKITLLFSRLELVVDKDKMAFHFMLRDYWLKLYAEIDKAEHERLTKI
jgi:hypothetical protein